MVWPCNRKKGLSAVIASTNGTIEPISKLIRLEKIHLIYNGVDVDYLQSIEPNRLGFDDNDILIGRASRFGRGKNLSLLIKATREIVKEHPHVRLVLVGGNSKLSEGLSDEESYLRDQAKDLPDHIIFTGQVEDPESLIAGFDIGTCSSRPNNEGIPNSLIECMALKKPVISTEVDNIGELVIDGKNGFLVGDNDLEGFVEALKKLITSREVRFQLGHQGYLDVLQKFNLKKQAIVYGELYNTLLGGASPKGLSLRWRVEYSLVVLFKVFTSALIPSYSIYFLRRIRHKVMLLLDHPAIS